MQQPAQTNLGIEPTILVSIYRQMSRIRAVDKAIQAGLSGGKFLFSYWPMTGQESIPATISQLISSRDYMVTTYRGIHDQVAKGVPLVGLFAEALGPYRRRQQRQGRLTAHLRSRPPAPC